MLKKMFDSIGRYDAKSWARYLVFSLLAAWFIGSSLAWVREDSMTHQAWPGAEFVELPSGKTHYIDMGPRDAPVVLLFHGSGRGIADWQEGFASALARDHRVIGFDYYGNGFSDRGFGLTYGYDIWSRQAIELLDALEIEQAVLVGHSVGGVVATVTAVDNPSRATGLVTIGTGNAIDPTHFALLIPGVGELLLGSQSNFSETFSEQHAEFISKAHNVRGSRWAFLVYLRRQYTVDGLRMLNGLYDDILVPTLHVSGTKDQSVSHEAARTLALQTGGAWRPFDGLGHNLHIEAPEQLASVVSRFSAGAVALKH
ncbi:alpha/beta fold hydrolase [Altererythrobacter litoralis]|uniref:Alpha/beta hydrolase n=1 Tax=Altererythrobacter litoralis TaxID=3113904 RepID=A0ABU7GF34_9SPHN|nr:alpha/beta hydrolase [Erythrobacteraceae bacterium 1XM1-14]